jgi:uncharacterized protein
MCAPAPADLGGYGAAMSETTIDYIELPAVDLVATRAFYSEAFGWQWVDYGPTYSASQSGSVEIALNAEATPGPVHQKGAQSAIGPLVLLRTADLESIESSVRDAGGNIVSSIYPYPGGRRFHFTDPSGNVLGAYQPQQ